MYRELVDENPAREPKLGGGKVVELKIEDASSSHWHALKCLHISSLWHFLLPFIIATRRRLYYGIYQSISESLIVSSILVLINLKRSRLCTRSVHVLVSVPA